MKDSKQRKLRIVLWLLLAFVLYYIFFPAFYRGVRLRAQVVDSVTLQPVANVDVHLYWNVSRPTLNMSSIARDLHDVSATTDQNGYFEVAAWGPVAAPRWYWLSSDEPHLYLNREGYQERLIGYYIEYLDARGFAPIFWPRVLDADWNGRRINFAPIGAPPIRIIGGEPY